MILVSAYNLNGNKVACLKYTCIYVTGFGKTNHNVTFCISRNTVLKY